MKNFFETNDEKITEKAFTHGLAISILSIVLCMVALCSITFAWFNGSVESKSNKLESGSFDIAVASVTQTKNADGTDANNSITASEDGTYKLSAPGTYKVILNPDDRATVKGYCVVTVDSTKVYKTGVILDEDMVDEIYKEATAPFEFTIVTEKADTVVSFEAHWGVLLNPEINKDGVINVDHVVSQGTDETTSEQESGTE